MTDKASKSATIFPISKEDVDSVALFLHKHMNDKFSPSEWEAGLRATWSEKSSNHGFMLKDEGRVVGAICALYSDQEINGKLELICNPHTWCVLEPYRGKSVALVLSVIRQKGMHFTMYSPNSEGEEIFSFLGFKPLGRETHIVVNLPTLSFGKGPKVFETSVDTLEGLCAKDRLCLKDHENFQWLNFVLFKSENKSGFLIYKQERFKKLPCANIIYVSDRGLFSRSWPRIRTTLLIKYGFPTSKIEQRIIQGSLPFSFASAPASAKFYMSDTLPPEVFDYTYSELVAMDL